MSLSLAPCVPSPPTLWHTKTWWCFHDVCEEHSDNLLAIPLFIMTTTLRTLRKTSLKFNRKQAAAIDRQQHIIFIGIHRKKRMRSLRLPLFYYFRLKILKRQIMTHKFLGAREAGRNIKRWWGRLLFCQQSMMSDNNNTLFVQPRGCFSSRSWRREGRLYRLRSLCSIFYQCAKPHSCPCSLRSPHTPACQDTWCSQPPVLGCWAHSPPPQVALAPHANINSILILKAPVFQALSSWSLCSSKNNTPEQPGI